MKIALAASSAVVIAGALWVRPAAAQTIGQPYAGQAAYPYAGPAATQPYAAPYAGRTAAPYYRETASGSYPGVSTSAVGAESAPRGPYLSECREVRMLQGTLTAFCPKGDGTWHTTQLVGAAQCAGNVENAGGDLVCGAPPQIGSTAPPQSYPSSAGSTYATPALPPAPAPVAPVAGPYPPAYPPVAGPVYPAPAYPYGVPSQYQYIAPSAGRTAQPWGY